MDVITSVMRQSPPTKPSKDAFSRSMTPSLPTPRPVLSDDETLVSECTCSRIRCIKLSTVGATNKEEEQVEEDRSEHGQEENDERDKTTEQETEKDETDKHSNTGTKSSAHRHVQVEGICNEGAADGSENHGQVRKGGEVTTKRVTANDYGGVWTSWDDGEIGDEEEKVVGREGEILGESRKRPFGTMEVFYCSAPEERPDKRSKHDSGEKLDGAATYTSAVSTTSRKTRRDARRVITMGLGTETG